MKPGELERNLSRLVEVARTARERLVAIEREMTELRHDLETLAARSPRGQHEESHGREQGERATESGSGRPLGPPLSGSPEAGSE